MTGTFAGVAPVVEVDGRVLGEENAAHYGKRGPMVECLQQLYLQLLEQECPSA